LYNRVEYKFRIPDCGLRIPFKSGIRNSESGIFGIIIAIGPHIPMQCNELTRPSMNGTSILLNE
jgi:hypothetical protein